MLRIIIDTNCHGQICFFYVCRLGVIIITDPHCQIFFVFLQVRGNQGQESTWSNVFKKLKIMIPYVWPKGSLWRQSLVILCLVSLGIGRAVNVFVPIYSKYIGKHVN